MHTRPHTLKLRFNHRENCWQVWNYLSRHQKIPQWKWFSITPQQARFYAERGNIPVHVCETVSLN